MPMEANCKMMILIGLFLPSNQLEQEAMLLNT